MWSCVFPVLGEGGVVGGDGIKGFADFEAAELVEGGVGEGVGPLAQGGEERGFAEAPADEAVFGQVEDAVEAVAQGRGVEECGAGAAYHQGAQFGGAVAVAVEGGVGGECVGQRGEVFHEARVEGRRREGVADGLGADGTEFEGAPRGQVLEFEGPQPGDVGGRRLEGTGAVGGGGGIPVFGLDARAADVFGKGDGGKLRYLPPRSAQ